MRILFLIIFPLVSFTQDVEIGYWKDYLAYNQVTDLAIVNEKTYCIAQGGVFYYNNEDNSINRISKINGLSENQAEQIAFDKISNTILISYENCNIDLVQENEIINIPDVKRKEISGLKKINNVYFKNNLAYLSCSFGVVVLDLIKKEIKDTYKIGENGVYLEINQTTIIEEDIYVATNQGLYYSEANNQFLSDYTQWTKDTFFTDSSLINASFTNIGSFNNLLISIIEGQKDYLFIKNQTWEKLIDYGFERPQLNISTNNIYITDSNSITIINSNHQENIITSFTDAYTCEEKRENEIWIADKTDGLLKYISGVETERYLVNSPISNKIYSLEFFSNKLFINHGGHMNFSVNMLNNDGASFYKNLTWKNLDFFDLNRARDIVAVASIGNADYYASWYNGISKMEDETHIIKYGYQNTGGVLDTTFYSNNRIQISDLVIDNNNNLWGLNSQVEKPLFVKKSDDSWFSFSMNQNIDGLYFDELLIDNSNYKWGVIHEGGLFVYNDNNTIENSSDDEYKILNTTLGNGNLPSTNIRTIEKDIDGEIWIGSDQGIAVIYSPELAFTGYNFDAQQILIQEGEYGQYLLSSEKINCIEIDGANRKWIGTENSGLFLLSEDGTEEVLHFTKENSPIFSNKIIDICINHENGEVFIGTDLGLMSYRSDATVGEIKQNKTFVFPNPVKENYRGNIAINKLVRDARVKITDINGNLVFETIANGGQANWDGMNYNNERVGTGVYLVFSTDENGYEQAVSKILFIK